MPRLPSLSTIAEDVCSLLESAIEGATLASDPRALGEQADAVCTYYQGVGICELLLDAETDAFFHHMIRSAQTRRWLLERCARLPPDQLPDVAVASNTRGLFAAVLARQWGLAADIARLSPATPRRDTEYEDDFWYARALHLILLGAPKADVEAALASFATALQGDESPRLDLLRALLARDAGAAAKGFEALLEEREAKLAKMKKDSALSRDSLFKPFSAIYVEGLAWLALLERAGLPTEPEYTFCPSLARLKKYAPFQASTFPGQSL